jgi:hypothetical protein
MERDEIIAILTSEAAGRISFSLSTDTTPLITVNSSTFLRVAELVRSGRVGVATLGDDEPAERVGSYDQMTDTLYHRRGLGRRFYRGTIIHEAVHISFDATRAVVSFIDNETAAWIAMAVYFRRTGLPLARWRDAEIAAAAADSIIANGAPTAAQIQSIRRFLLAGHYGDVLRDYCRCSDPDYLIRKRSYHNGVRAAADGS